MLIYNAFLYKIRTKLIVIIVIPKIITLSHYKIEITKIKATIADDSESLFTPCTYKLVNVQIIEGTKTEPIEEIVSFRGRFCEQAKSSETVIAEGKLERVQQKGKRDHFRLLLGSKPSDHK